jgi:tetratricopeptide (TPR) repeat protein
MMIESPRNCDIKSAPCGLPRWGQAALIALMVLLAYSSVFHAGFIWDDDSYITENLNLLSLSGLSKIWFSPGSSPQYYPLVFTVFWAEYHLWGFNPVGYHLVNIVIHLLNALLVWTVLSRFNFKWAFWAAAIFALHPVHVESVAWVTELKNVLSLLFYLLALLAYLRYLNMAAEVTLPEARSKTWYIAALICFFLALLSKTVTATLPATILLLIWWRRGRITWQDSAGLSPFFILGVSMGLLTARVEVYHVHAAGPEWDYTLLERILIAGRAVWFYAGKLLWPHPLIFSYPRWTIDAVHWQQYLFPLGLFGLVGLLWFLRDKIGRGPLTAVLFFVGTLFPALCFFNIYPMLYSFVADHFQYAASLGLICLCCASADRFFRQFRHTTRLPEAACYCCILVLLGFVTWKQGGVYTNNFTLFTDVVEKNPSSWLGYTNRSMEYMDQGRFDPALADMEHAIKVHPRKAEAIGNRAVLRQRNGDYQGALADFTTAIHLDPAQVNVLINRSDLYLLLHRYDMALKDCDEALTRKSDSIAGYLQRALVYGHLGNSEKKLADLSRVLQLDPENLAALADRGLTYYEMGQPGKAVDDFSKALKIYPESAALYYKRALALAAAGDRTTAATDLQRARRWGYALSEDQVQNVLEMKRVQ